MKTNSLKKNTIFNAIKSFSTIIYPLIMFSYASRVLTAENIGKVNYTNSIIAYFSLIASLGVGTYAIRECSKVKGNREQLEKTASQIFTINLLSTLVSYLLLLWVIVFFNELKAYWVLLIVQSLSIIMNTVGADWINVAMEDFKYITTRTVVIQVASLILTLAFVRKPEDYIKYAIINTFAVSGTNLINIAYRKKYCRLKFVFDNELVRHIKPILLMFSLIFSQTIYVNSDTTIIGIFRGDYEVGLYSTAVKIYTIVNTLVSSVSLVVLPRLSGLFVLKKYDKINELLNYSLDFIIVLGLPCICGLNVIASDIIYVIAGEEYTGANMALHILTIALLFSFIGGWLGNMILLPSGKEKVCLRISMVAATVNLVLNIFLIPRWGMNVAAVTTALSEFVSVVLLVPHVDKGIKIEGVKEKFKAPIIGCVLIVTIGIFSRCYYTSIYAIVFTVIGASIISYCLVLLITKNQFFYGFINPLIEKLGRRKHI